MNKALPDRMPQHRGYSKRLSSPNWLDIKDWRRSSWPWALMAVLVVLSWQTLTVHANYEGNWSGLFRVGHSAPLPPQLNGTTFRNAHPSGCDGQYYRLLAMDPFLRHDTAAYLDSPLLRSRRILMPLSAWVLATGQLRFVDGAYVLLMALFAGMGVYCLAKVMVFHGRHPALGLLFLLIPAAPIAVDSMTVDISLIALTASFTYQASAGQTRGMWWTLAAAALSRETGVLLPAAAVIAALIERTPRKALLWASSICPALFWYAYLYRVLPASALKEGFYPAWFVPHLRAGIVLRTLNPPQHPLLAPNVQFAVRALDVLALVSTIALVILGAVLVRKMRPVALRAATIAFIGLVAIATDRDFWNTPYGYARPIAPLFVLLIVAVSNSKSKFLLPAAALLCVFVDLRIFAEMEKQAMGVLQLFAGG
jgi:hypothetical protein